MIKSPDDAISQGIGMVHQHFMLVQNFSVIENVILGAEARHCSIPRLTRRVPNCGAWSANTASRSMPDAIIEELPVGLQQRVEILKALYRGAEILILDEPTGVLTPSEADHLFPHPWPSSRTRERRWC